MGSACQRFIIAWRTFRTTRSRSMALHSKLFEISPRFSSMKIVSAKIIKRSRPIYPLRITTGNRLNAPLYYRAAFRSSFSASSKNYYIRAGFRDLSRGTRDFRSKPRSRSRPYTVIETELLRSRNLLSSMEMIRR